MRLRGHLILVADLDGVGVEKGLGRASALGPGADHQPGIVIHRQGVAGVEHLPAIGDEVVFEDRGDGGLHVVARVDVAQPEHIRPPLADELFADHAVEPGVAGVLAVIDLAVILAIPAQLVGLLGVRLSNTRRHWSASALSPTARAIFSPASMAAMYMLLPKLS